MKQTKWQVDNSNQKLCNSNATFNFLFQLKKSMEILFYRDCRAVQQYTQGICTADGARVEGPFGVGQNWEYAKTVVGY